MLSDIIVHHESLNYWISNYGSIAIFFLLALGIFALPIPDETLMVLSGILISEDKLPLFPTIVSCLLGAMCGITLSFTIGAVAGKYLIRKGGWLGFTEQRRNEIHLWFRRYGKWALVIGYYFAGIRHLTGIFAGMGKLEFPQFAMYAYSGAILWTTTFLSIGYFFGNFVIQEFEHYEGSIDLYVIALVVCILGFIAWRHVRRE